MVDVFPNMCRDDRFSFQCTPSPVYGAASENGYHLEDLLVYVYTTRVSNSLGCYEELTPTAIANRSDFFSDVRMFNFLAKACD